MLIRLRIWLGQRLWSARDSDFVLVKRPRHPAKQHKGAGGAGFGHLGDLFVRGVLFEIHKCAVELAQEMVDCIAEDRVLFHPAR